MHTVLSLVVACYNCGAIFDDDALINIFSYNEIDTLLTARLVCKPIKALIENNIRSIGEAVASTLSASSHG